MWIQLNFFAKKGRNYRRGVAAFLIVWLILFFVEFSPAFSLGHSAYRVLVRSDRPIGHHLFDDWYVVEVTAQSEGEAIHEAKQMRGVLGAEPDALLGRLRLNCKLRCAPSPPTGQRGTRRFTEPSCTPGEPSLKSPPIRNGSSLVKREEYGCGDGARFIIQEYANTILDVVRVDDPAFDQPLIVGTTARELSSEEVRSGYGHRWPVETNFYVAQDSAAMEMPRAWTETALNRRISLALLSGSLLKAISAHFEALAIGPWDLKAVPSAGRSANYLDIRASNFSGLAYHMNQACNSTILF